MKGTRTKNPNGTYKYTIEGVVKMKASKRFYEEFQAYQVGKSPAPYTTFGKNIAARYREYHKGTFRFTED